MYCVHCGNNLKDNDKYCGKCGKAVLNNSSLTNNVQSQQNIKDMKPKKNIGAIIIALIFPILIIIFLVIFLISIFFVNENFNDDLGKYDGYYVYLESDMIPTVKKVLGARDVCYYNDELSDDPDTTIVFYGYCMGELTESDYDSYITYLIDNENFVVLDENDEIILGKESNINNMMLLVEIDEFSDQIFYLRKIGNIDDYFSDFAL